jgi:hypothetical protein
MPAFAAMRPGVDTWRFGVTMAGSFGVAMTGDILMAGSFGVAMAGDTLMAWARASPAPANARHRAIDTNAHAFHEGNRNFTSLAINLLDLPMDCSSNGAGLSLQ